MSCWANRNALSFADMSIGDAFQEKSVFVGVEGGEGAVRSDGVVPKPKAVHRFCVQNGLVKSVKLVVFYHYAFSIASVEESLLASKVGDFGVYGYDGTGELILAGECIDKPIASDGYIAACTCLIPSIAVAAQQNGGS